MEKYAGTQAIARTFTLINLFDDKRPFWSLPDLIKQSGLKRTTVFRIMSALEAEGVIRKNEFGDYALGSKLIALGGRAIRSNPLRTVAQPFLKKIVQETAESATIDILWIDEEGQPISLVIEEVLGQYLLGMSQFIGARFPAHTTSTGKVLLAFTANPPLPNDPITQYTNNSIKSVETLLAELQTVRQQGYATTINELEVGLSAVAAPIFNLHGEVHAALCIGGPSSRISEEKRPLLAQTVMKYADEISLAMGYEAEREA
ncbi:MAG: IclR family transcriptional regulator [Chloroflexota bacterium]